MGRGEVQSLLRMEALPSFFLLLLLTWTAEETFCKPAPGECMAWSWSSATGWKCTQEINTDPVDLDKFRRDSLAAHNAYRAKHGVAALKLSSKLNARAQAKQRQRGEHLHVQWTGSARSGAGSRRQLVY